MTIHPTRIGLIGDPVAHSLSPAFQQAAFDALGLPLRYELWHTPAADIPERVTLLRSGDALGANVTVPHKEAFVAAVDELSDLARRVGAVNTVVARGRRLYGDNTDVHGFLVPLVERSFDFAGSRAVVIGAGGAARGVVVALLSAGIDRVTVLNRTLERARQLVAALDDGRLSAAPLDDAPTVVQGAHVLVNATTMGWSEGRLPLDPAALTRMAADGIAYDLTYRATPFLDAAREAGLVAIDGLTMLVHQGARSFELWTGQEAPVEVMWRAAVTARDRRGN
jgi:shikimate dehydrogenase